MSIYFDFKTISELTGEKYNYYRQQKEFTLDELSQYNGRNGNPAYVAIEGIVYDVSNESAWNNGNHMGITAGEDLTEQFNYCHGINGVLANAPKIGILTEDNDMEYRANRQMKQNTSKFKPDDWIRYIEPLVSYAMRETNQQGTAARQSYQKYMLLGVLVGLGKTPQDAIKQVQEWQTTGASQILKSAGTTTSAGSGTSGGTTAGTGTGSGTTGGTGTGGGTTGGTSGGFGGTGTSGTTGGTSGGFGGMGTGGGTTGGTSGGFGGTGTGGGTTGGTSGGFGGFGTGGGTTGGTSGGFGGTGTGRGMETTDDTDRRDRLYFD